MSDRNSGRPKNLGSTWTLTNPQARLEVGQLVSSLSRGTAASHHHRDREKAVGTDQQVARPGPPHETGSCDLEPLVASIDIEALSSHLTEVILDEVYGHVIDPEILRPFLSKALVEKMVCLADLMRAKITLDDIEAPAALALAEEVGRQGISEQTLERSYRVGIEALWDWWLSVVEEHCRETDYPVADVVRASSPIIFGFVDRMLFVSVAAYHRAVSQRQQTREHRRVRIVDQLLDETLAEPGADVERFIGYAFAYHHLAAVLDTGDGAEDKKLAGELKTASGAAEALVLDRGSAATELWLGLRAPVTEAKRADLVARAASAGRRIAFGDVERGLAGFRNSMRSARNAAKIQAMLADNSPQVLWANDVRIETLALDNPERARELVGSVLGTALEQGLLTPRVRETLDAWLATGSYVGAAAVLGVHEQTVRQRLHRLEEALGQSLQNRRTELHVALRLSMLTLPPDRAH
jgi:DNA-binding PucR family transcriptional regulator